MKKLPLYVKTTAGYLRAGSALVDKTDGAVRVTLEKDPANWYRVATLKTMDRAKL